MFKSAVLLVYISITVIHAQLDTTAFFEHLNEKYYNLEQTDTENASVWISSDLFNQKTARYFSKDIYPIEMIWARPADLYFIQRPLPSNGDSLIREFEQLQFDLQNELLPILTTWKQFYGSDMLRLIPDRYSFRIIGDTVAITFSIHENQVELNFSPEGKCLRFVRTDSVKNQKQTIYPEFGFVGRKWLCSGWISEISADDLTHSRVEIRIVSGKINGIYFPEKFIYRSIFSDSNSDEVNREYFFKNIRINRELKFFN